MVLLLISFLIPHNALIIANKALYKLFNLFMPNGFSHPKGLFGVYNFSSNFDRKFRKGTVKIMIRHIMGKSF